MHLFLIWTVTETRSGIPSIDFHNLGLVSLRWGLQPPIPAGRVATYWDEGIDAPSPDLTVTETRSGIPSIDSHNQGLVSLRWRLQPPMPAGRVATYRDEGIDAPGPDLDCDRDEIRNSIYRFPQPESRLTDMGDSSRRFPDSILREILRARYPISGCSPYWAHPRDGHTPAAGQRLSRRTDLIRSVRGVDVVSAAPASRSPPPDGMAKGRITTLLTSGSVAGWNPSATPEKHDGVRPDAVRPPCAPRRNRVASRHGEKVRAAWATRSSVADAGPSTDRAPPPRGVALPRGICGRGALRRGEGIGYNL